MPWAQDAQERLSTTHSIFNSASLKDVGISWSHGCEGAILQDVQYAAGAGRARAALNDLRDLNYKKLKDATHRM